MKKLTKKQIHKIVDYSIKKYGKTYKMLEKYDMKRKTTTGWTNNWLDRMTTFPYETLNYKGDIWIRLSDATEWVVKNK